MEFSSGGNIAKHSGKFGRAKSESECFHELNFILQSRCFLRTKNLKRNPRKPTRKCIKNSSSLKAQKQVPRPAFDRRVYKNQHCDKARNCSYVKSPRAVGCKGNYVIFGTSEWPPSRQVSSSSRVMKILNVLARTRSPSDKASRRHLERKQKSHEG